MKVFLITILCILNLVVLRTDAIAGKEINVIEFWHAMDGHHGVVVEELVAKFNQSQKEIPAHVH